ncbi:MAG: Ku protein, partial [Pseudolabrys sp.]|nr:Ku protein [Pseudolabrys sp.]
FEDRYENALNELIKAKRAGKKPPVVHEERPSNVINLMDALRKSARAEKSSGGKAAPRRATKKTTHARKKPAAKRRKAS